MQTQNLFLMALAGILVGVGASFTGLGGGFLIVPLLLFLGYTAQKSVGTSFLAILVISISALFAHNKLANIDYRAGLLLGIGGIIGAQVGARLGRACQHGQLQKNICFYSSGIGSLYVLQKIAERTGGAYPADLAIQGAAQIIHLSPCLTQPLLDHAHACRKRQVPAPFPALRPLFVSGKARGPTV